jgi:uncharacterized protein YidB (DUF937 family)
LWVLNYQEKAMGMLDGILGGVVGAGVMSALNGIIEKHGGVQGIVSQFEKQGLGDTVKSWIGTGPNQAISSDQLHKALGSDAMQQLATRTGLSLPELSQKLAQFLPQAIDKLTPNGVVPKI